MKNVIYSKLRHWIGSSALSNAGVQASGWSANARLQGVGREERQEGDSRQLAGSWEARGAGGAGGFGPEGWTVISRPSRLQPPAPDLVAQ